MRSLAPDLSAEIAQHETSRQDYGLKEDWASIRDTLEEIIPVYDKTNRYISLGTDLKLRRRGIALLDSSIGREEYSVADLGCGTGRMTQLLFEKKQNLEDVLLVDPIFQMMKIAKSRNPKAQGLLAVFENIPLCSASFDSLVAGFSLRDAKDLRRALSEINRVLKPGGKFLIVDLSKPDSRLKSSLISFYWRTLAPMIAFISSGRLGLKFGSLATTFKRLPKISQFYSLVKDSGFEVSNSEFSMMGGACVILLTKTSPG
jgi:demethylmenaquinone methyltransferase / 2-methoxy-6-polyprenyl-1,4-benzoquinol methylase